jgi:anti-anti-sigma factor
LDSNIFLDFEVVKVQKECMYKAQYDMEKKICTLYLDGTISLKSALALKDQIISESNSGFLDIILDFNQNVHVDSSGIGAIFNSQKYLIEKKGSLKLKNLSHDTLSILKIANLDKLLTII